MIFLGHVDDPVRREVESRPPDDSVTTTVNLAPGTLAVWRGPDRSTIYTRTSSLDGTIHGETFWKAGRMHRAGGPAVVYYRSDGSVSSAEWCSEGETHRLDGPAEVGYFPDGSLESENFAVAGERLEDRADLLPAVRRHPGIELGYVRAEIAAGHLRVLLDEGFDPYAIVGAVGAGASTVEGVRGLLEGAPPEWVRAYEDGAR